MECQEGKKNGFVNFKTRTFNDEDKNSEKRQRHVEIPIHLRSAMPDPHAGSYTKSSQQGSLQSSSSYASEAERLRAEADAAKKELEAKRAEMLQSIGKTSQASSSVLSVPSLSFKRRR